MTRLSLFLVPAVAALIAAAACGDDSAEAPSPTGTVTAVPEVTPSPARTPSPTPSEAGGIEGFRAFAVVLDEALVAKDGDFFAERVLEGEITCAGDELVGPCFAQPEGTVLRGITSTMAQSDFITLYEASEYGEMLEDWLDKAATESSDSYAGGAPSVLALASTSAEDDEEGTFHAVVTELFSDVMIMRQTRILNFHFLDGEWRLVEEFFGSAPELVRGWLLGDCDECYDHWERLEG
jgi:hypothetical protein